jgi:hypothetical protein
MDAAKETGGRVPLSISVLCFGTYSLPKGMSLTIHIRKNSTLKKWISGIFALPRSKLGTIEPNLSPSIFLTLQ